MMTEISIHALLAESDTRRTYHKDESQEFLSTLSLRRATGILAISLRIVFAEFLSTLSLRRATAFSFALLYSTTISIHALLAESDWQTTKLEYNPIISIHALLAESDQRICDKCAFWLVISIHALLAESDTTPCQSRGQNHNFYPRSPCGERHRISKAHGRTPAISIHALLAESDVTVLGIQHRVGISIHALLAESDRHLTTWSLSPLVFLSTLSLRRATRR